MTLKVGITGVPGSGKTTLARALSVRCREIPGLKNIELISEYARHYLSKHGAVTSVLEQYRILEKQLEWEESVCNDKLDIMITDSPIFLGFFYSCSLPKSNSKEVMFFNDIFKKMVEINYPIPRYDIIFHLCPILEPVKDGIRCELYFDEMWIASADRLIRSTMDIFKPANFFIIEKEELIEERTTFCLNKIRMVLKRKV